MENIPDSRLSEGKIEVLYNNLAHFYDLWGIQAEGKARNRGIELAQICNGETILEVAVGTGLTMVEIARKNFNGINIGIDISPGMLNMAKEKLSKYPNVELKLANALKIPYPDHSFDLLVNAYMFDLLPFDKMPKVLAEFWRVLKSEGRLIMVNMTVGEKPASQLYQWIYNHAPTLMGGCRGVCLSELLVENGFDVIVREYSQQLLFPSEVIFSRKQISPETA